MPSYITLITFAGGKTREASRELKSLTQKPPSNIKVLGHWTSFGRYDAVCLFQAENETDAMNFVSEKVRSIEGVLSTETLVAVPETETTPGASKR